MPSGNYLHKRIDMTGQIIGYSRIDGLAYYDSHGTGYWSCTCLYNNCGKKFVRSRCSLIKHKADANCGCYSKKKHLNIIRNTRPDSIRHLPHGERLTNIYKDMIKRCECKNQKSYRLYGGKGVIVCPEWRHSKRAFYEWAITHGYRDDLTIDRIDSNGNYEPQNCRWVDRYVQNNNTSRNVRYEYRGNTYSIKELSRVTGIKVDTIRNRLKKGYNVEQACNPYDFKTGKLIGILGEV